MPARHPLRFAVRPLHVLVASASVCAAAGCSDATGGYTPVLESAVDRRVRLDISAPLQWPDSTDGPQGGVAGADAAMTDAGTPDAGNADTGNADAAKADASDTSTPPAGSCAAACGQPFDPVRGCSCLNSCAKAGDCCGDWAAQCYKGPALDWAYPQAGQCTKGSDWVQVASNPDGDTLYLKQTDASGEQVRVRLLLVDTPELSGPDCHAKEASAFTYQALVRSKFKACLVDQPGGEDTDAFGRLLRYVYLQEPGQSQPVQLNLRLLRQGMARVLYPYIQGNPYELQALATMAQAKAEKLGGWGACGWVKPK